MQPSEAWLNHIKEEGVRLTVEVDLTYEEFKKLNELGFGVPLSDSEVVDLWSIVNRRILPSCSSSFSGIGGDINAIVKKRIKDEYD